MIRRALAAALTAAVATALAVAPWPGATPSASAAVPSAVTVTSPGSSPVTVPAGVAEVAIEAWGAQGGKAGSGFGRPGGPGGYVRAVVDVTAGQTLDVTAGGAGGDGNLTGAAALGGTPDGGRSSTGAGGGGGGSSRVTRDGTVLAVGGGGGGSYISFTGGSGGGTTGGSSSGAQGASGQGGTQSAPGLGGSDSVGGSSTSGGGGGGYFGGGRGIEGGGGGGSGYGPAGATLTNGVDAANAGNGKVVLTWLEPASITIVQAAGETQTFSFTGDLGAFELTTGASQTFDVLAAGTYNVTQSATSGWSFTSLSCEPSQPTADATATITVANGDDVTCTFTNTKHGVPGAPTNVSAVAGQGSVTVQWDAPTDDGLSAITDYDVVGSPDGSCHTDGAGRSCTVYGLTTGIDYSFAVTAANNVGAGAPATSNTVQPQGLPHAATNVVATPGDGQINLSWTAPTNTGALAITSYDVGLSSGTPADGYAGCIPGANTECVINHLVNGTEYVFVVSANNTLGSGPSASSNAVTPIGVPGKPSLTATPGGGQIELSWTADAQGSPITSFTVSSPQGVTCDPGVGTSCVVTGLVNGTAYAFTVQAHNAVGDSPISDEVTATPLAVPGAPTNVSAVPGDGSATVSWAPPVDTGGSAVIGYRAVASFEGSDVTSCTTDGAGSHCELNGSLENGRTYLITVTAQNAVGTGASATTIVNPLRRPFGPTIESATAGDQQITVSWQPPNDGGRAIDSYKVIAAIGGTEAASCTTDGAGRTCTVTGLTNGTVYTVSVVAHNEAGDGDSSGGTTQVRPRGIPGAPVILPAIRGDGSLVLFIDFTNVDDNGAPIDQRVATCTPTDPDTGSAIGDGVQQTAIGVFSFTGLTNGTTYRCTAVAHNEAGFGPASAAVDGTPAAVPGTPTDVAATPGDRQASVEFVAPADNGSPITGYNVRCFSPQFGDQSAASGNASPIVVGSLIPNRSYSCSARAANAVGEGPATNNVTVTPYAAPSALPRPSATAGDGQIRVSFGVPSGTDNGSAITSFEATCTPTPPPPPDDPDDEDDTPIAAVPGVPVVATGTGSPITVTGLANRQPYTCTVRAQNAAGWGPASPASLPATPRTVPGAPSVTGVSVGGDGEVVVEYTAPTDNGGARIKQYTAVCTALSNPDVRGTRSISDSQPASAPDLAPSPITVHLLTFVGEYTCTVKAVNVAGAGTPSAPSAAIQPLGTPEPPTPTGVQEDDQSLHIQFTPAATGRVATGFTAECTRLDNSNHPVGDPIEGSGATSPVTVSGLQNGKRYECTVRADHDVTDPSEFSDDMVTGTPRTHPAQASIEDTRARNGRIEVWIDDPSNDGGAEIDQWKATCTPAIGGTPVSATSDPADNNVVLVTGLTNGTAYTCTAQSGNEAGFGPESDPTDEVTPYLERPSGASPNITPLDRALDVFVSVRDDGGESIIGAKVTCVRVDSNGDPVDAPIVQTAASRSVLFESLVNGSPYRCKAIATNVLGDSAESDYSDPVAPRTTPGAPHKPLVRTGSSGQVIVTMDEDPLHPIDDGGASITSYAATCSDGSDWSETVGSGPEITVNGLTNWSEHHCMLAAFNDAGWGAVSEPSDPVVPRELPGAPRSLSITPAGSGAAQLTFAPPTNNGGQPVTAYNARCAAAGHAVRTLAGVGSPMTVASLVNGITYRCTVRAVNLGGEGAIAVGTVRVGAPGAPSSVAVVKGASNGTLKISWGAAASNGAPITRYVVTCTPASGPSKSVVSTGSPRSIGGLMRNKRYDCKVAAVNRHGTSAWTHAPSAVQPLER
jgi:titin